MRFLSPPTKEVGTNQKLLTISLGVEAGWTVPWEPWRASQNSPGAYHSCGMQSDFVLFVIICGIPKIAGHSAGRVAGLLGITHETGFCHSANQHFALGAGD